MESIVYVGMDVHKATYSLCALDKATGALLAETQCASEPKLVEKFINGLAEELDPDTKFVTGYEAGILGYSLYRSLKNLGIDCIILAPTTMY
ncbi:IS110 family transposase, partial [Salmonella enterica subsp. enterica serovar Istanbul]|nr:IS110 family transposase [Salmonella enterica subsp. enterica serovar Istanbul]